MANDNDKTGDTGYDPREWEAVGGKRPLRPSPEFMADPDVQAQMNFDDFINSPEGMKLLREMHEKFLAEEAAEATTQRAPNVNNRNNLRSRTEDVSRKVLADEEAKLAPKYAKPLAADTE
tara:strand:+ start:468 stop:827 length:360 start_codon:yes stop_codon:yes gene_type:complete